MSSRSQSHPTYPVSFLLNGLVLEVVSVGTSAPFGSRDGLQWTARTGQTAAEYSKDNFSGTLRINVRGSALDTYGLPGVACQWRVKEGDKVFADGEISASAAGTGPQKFVSDGDENPDAFFGNAAGTWSAIYCAEHQGIRCSWDGTGEQILLAGKNKLQDVFSGSVDANVLILTDDANGDALSLEDIYTSLPMPEIK